LVAGLILIRVRKTFLSRVSADIHVPGFLMPTPRREMP
jgi:hypothetical protein